MSIYPKVLSEWQNGKVSAKGKSTALAFRGLEKKRPERLTRRKPSYTWSGNCSGEEWYITGECPKQIHHRTLFCLRVSGSLQKTPLDVSFFDTCFCSTVNKLILSLSFTMQKSHPIVDKWTTEHFPTHGLSFPTLKGLWLCSKLFCDSFISHLQHGVT